MNNTKRTLSALCALAALACTAAPAKAIGDELDYAQLGKVRPAYFDSHIMQTDGTATKKLADAVVDMVCHSEDYAIASGAGRATIVPGAEGNRGEGFSGPVSLVNLNSFMVDNVWNLDEITRRYVLAVIKDMQARDAGRKSMGARNGFECNNGNPVIYKGLRPDAGGLNISLYDIDEAVSNGRYYKPSSVRKIDMWSALYYYLNAFSPAQSSSDYNFPPMRYRSKYGGKYINRAETEAILLQIRPGMPQEYMDDALDFVEEFMTRNDSRIAMNLSDFRNRLKVNRFIAMEVRNMPQMPSLEAFKREVVRRNAALGANMNIYEEKKVSSPKKQRGINEMARLVKFAERWGILNTKAPAPRVALPSVRFDR